MTDLGIFVGGQRLLPSCLPPTFASLFSLIILTTFHHAIQVGLDRPLTRLPLSLPPREVEKEASVDFEHVRVTPVGHTDKVCSIS